MGSFLFRRAMTPAGEILQAASSLPNQVSREGLGDRPPPPTVPDRPPATGEKPVHPPKLKSSGPSRPLRMARLEVQTASLLRSSRQTPQHQRRELTRTPPAKMGILENRGWIGHTLLNPADNIWQQGKHWTGIQRGREESGG